MHWVQFTIYAAQCILCTIYGTCWIEPSVTEACDKLQNFMNLHCKGKLNSWLPTQKKFQIFKKKKFDHLQRWTPVPRTPSAIASVSEKAKWRGKPTRRWLADILCSSCMSGCGRKDHNLTHKAIWSLVKRMKPGGVLQWLHGLRCQSCLTQVQEAACSAP